MNLKRITRWGPRPPCVGRKHVDFESTVKQCMRLERVIFSKQKHGEKSEGQRRAAHPELEDWKTYRLSS